MSSPNNDPSLADVAPQSETEVTVLVRDRGSSKPRTRGTLVLEDLSEVLTRISLRSGPNGPNAPISQYIVAEASRHLFTRLVGDISPGEGHAAPRVLSALIGHEPFVEGALNLSAHHMRRRWPIAADWYADLISYVLRPKRYYDNEEAVAEELVSWICLPFGAMAEQFAKHQIQTLSEPEKFRLPATFYALWPEYEPIQESYGEYRRSIQDIWAPLYQEMLNMYQLRLRDGVTIEDACWVFETIVAQASKDATLGWEVSTALPRATRAILSYVAGAVETQDGELLSLAELAERQPASL